MAATDKYLGLLHSEVAQVMRELIKPRNITEKDDDGKQSVRVEYPSPAILAVAVKFLKDNSISADIENDDQLKELKDALAKKRAPSKQDMKDALDEVGRSLLN